MTTLPRATSSSGLPWADTPLDDPERGWRYVRVKLPDGREVSQTVPLTPADFLNPQEGDVMPQRPFHAQATRDLADMLQTRYAGNPAVTVFNDLIMDWGIPGLPNPSPDVSIVPNVREPERERDGRFNVQKEGTRPILVIEVVSPQYRKEDREDKVAIYAKAGVHEYVIFDHRTRRGQGIDEALGYRLLENAYLPISPDEDGFVYCETVGLRMGLENGRVALIDGETGERLPTHTEAVARAEAETARAETEAARAETEAARAETEAARAEAEAAARKEAEARLAALEAELQRLRGSGEAKS
jgi:Uma2 family endonuclease